MKHAPCHTGRWSIVSLLLASEILQREAPALTCMSGHARVKEAVVNETQDCYRPFTLPFPTPKHCMASKQSTAPMQATERKRSAIMIGQAPMAWWGQGIYKFMSGKITGLPLDDGANQE